ncbi:hypothetical protein CYPRO_0489 [Cyclonatronum proteinivorum]|uniref:DUF7305 domain-containing protein n=1 Tax=Cyclonatronum proteinivorum TaxID=1457365 RepID=A0A345UH23_9BACT|nr:hypothetical protein [Cyclonatronum proteinivorum]AXI99774.1 hypothetical protein CYPRO_0489 [Cyclonatronum proteinivorum]
MGNYALILVMALSFAIAIYTVNINQQVLISENQVTESFSTSQARNVAQSAAQIAVAKILNGADTQFNPASGDVILFPVDGISFEPWPELGGFYRLRIENHADTLLQLQAIGVFGNQQYPVNVSFSPSAQKASFPNIDKAVFSRNSIRMEGSARILGPAGTNTISNSGVFFAWSPRVEGSLSIGPGGLPSSVVHQTNSGGNVDGNILVLPEERDYPLPVFPDFPVGNPTGTSVHLTGIMTQTLLPSDYHGLFLNQVSLENDTHLYIQTGGQHRELFVNNLTINQGHIHILGGGSLTIYVQNSFTLTGSSTVNNNAASDVMMFYSGSGEVNVGGNTRFRGHLFAETANVRVANSGGFTGHIITGGTSVIVSGDATAISRVLYAPNAHVRFEGSGRVRGAVVANTFFMGGDTRVIYDEDWEMDPPDLDFDITEMAFQVSQWN